MSSLTFYAAPGFGKECQQSFGFSDACIIGDRMEVTGQIGKDPLSDGAQQQSMSLEEEVDQAFRNVNSAILSTLEQANHPLFAKTKANGKSGWDLVVKLRSFHVGLAKNDAFLREVMVKNIKLWCPQHQPLFTMVGIEALPFPRVNVELEVDVHLG
ncbi:l-psp endoribonuclease family [Fusarium langsethiae]|uniref:L-psp endoribonuclease family n=1 Tax=Fusarium langsethiae TaxID=179993 RepID=A0A0N0DIA2_FUSLA|nr:l-psp endoribonuclease family [Fusarium langsethiae]GKU08558.1 unnamed protein product [Fusarium langsethiae]